MHNFFLNKKKIKLFETMNGEEVPVSYIVVGSLIDALIETNVHMCSIGMWSLFRCCSTAFKKWRQVRYKSYYRDCYFIDNVNQIEYSLQCLSALRLIKKPVIVYHTKLCWIRENSDDNSKIYLKCSCNQKWCYFEKYFMQYKDTVAEHMFNPCKLHLEFEDGTPDEQQQSQSAVGNYTNAQECICHLYDNSDDEILGPHFDEINFLTMDKDGTIW